VYGNPETTTGGNALKFYASVRLDIRKTGVLKNGAYRPISNAKATPMRTTKALVCSSLPTAGLTSRP
jgi:RecA/RadA recombinase